ncbi:hypothetical protein Nepgr_004672 [Nepenthes gracilis]|uniref:DNA repair protein REV1 n=1 Tax=Nepenthes gracilis TaxID=150966 RepID=A0AAD3XFG3_NEPGR|nr:hypothetical protein Nepgr_004672 [Nepenthes gracilis]
MSFSSRRSAKAISKSLGSRISYDSNPSDDSNSTNGSKKRKTTQKTLGVAWGSSSLSSSRSSFRNAPFSDFGSYMIEKNKKLHRQFDAEASSSSHSGPGSLKPIFEGVSIFVDGFTIPTSQELRGYMLKHGGRFENYFSRHHVTHIVCSNLPNSKIKNLRSFSGGLPVVKPTWVLDCVAAKKLLSWVPYKLDQLINEVHNQPKLSTFFALKSLSTREGSPSASSSIQKAESEDLESRGGTLNDLIYFEVGESSKCSRNYGEKISDDLHKITDAAINEGPAHTERELSELKTIGKASSDNPINSVAKCELLLNPLQRTASTSSKNWDKKSAEGSSSLQLGGPYHPHSTIADPNFIENYFKRSRLHFIGTWRNRYRQRYFGLSNGIKQTNFDANASVTSRMTTIIHVDMDCFFVSVVVRNHPELQDKPVAVCHSDSPKGTAEISSANYPARDYGVRAGMFVRDAKALCPHLVIVPYNFEAYEEVADQFYDILHKHCKKVQAVSCDEAFLDVTDSEEEDPEILASVIRKDIFEATGCTASAGIAGNLLMARLATRSAKPDGQCYIPPEKVDEYLLQLPIKALPGIGCVLEEKLKRQSVLTCGQLRMFSKESLLKVFGVKTGEMLWNYCRGVDNRLVGIIQESKSIGAEVNWGVRFNDLKDSHHFLLSLCKEVSLRLQGCGVQGRRFTLKIKKKIKDAKEPVKYMGCGDCENLSHTTMVPVATDDVDVLQRITMQLFGSFHIDVKDIRGFGLQVTKLENVDYSKQGNERNILTSWLASASVNSKKQHNIHGPAELMADGGKSCSISGEIFLDEVSELPSLHDLDISVLENLPPELFSEVNAMYAGKLIDFVSAKKANTVDFNGSVCSTLQEGVEGGILKEEEDGASCRSHFTNVNEKDEDRCHNDEEIQEASASRVGSAAVVSSVLGMEECDLMPSSLSQVDISVLQNLPEELRADIVGLLPAHRRPNCLLDSTNFSLKKEGERTIMGHSAELGHASKVNLWDGNPPHWVDEFRLSHCLLLNILAEMYVRSVSTGQLSSILQCFISQCQLVVVASDAEMDEATNSLCELVKQYITLKIETDIEEIYLCFCLLKRFAVKSEVLSRVYDIVVPYLQASVGESYGGSLNLSPLIGKL